MEDMDALRSALCTDPKPTRRERRARATLAYALSPRRILMQVLLLPVAIVAIAISVYVRTSPYDGGDALRHLAALAGCDTALSMGLAPAMQGEIGYHARNDSDGDGIACAEYASAALMPPTAGPRPARPPQADADPDTRRIGGAKFLRP